MCSHSEYVCINLRKEVHNCLYCNIVMCIAPMHTTVDINIEVGKCWTKKALQSAVGVRVV